MFTPTGTPGVYTATDASDAGSGVYTLEDGVETSPGVYTFTTGIFSVTVALGSRRWSAALDTQRWAGVLS